MSLVRNCEGCGQQINSKHLLKALDRYWHEDCLKCGCCDCRLGEVGHSLYTKGNLLLCKRDYLRLFGSTGYCAACDKVIPAFELVMRARTNVYHLECFACQQCSYRFCVGEEFFLLNNRIVCSRDYEAMFRPIGGPAGEEKRLGPIGGFSDTNKRPLVEIPVNTGPNQIKSSSCKDSYQNLSSHSAQCSA